MSSLTMAPGRAVPVEGSCVDCPPAELIALRDRIRRMSPAVRAELEPIVEQALEEAHFRGRVLTVAREALIRLRLDLALARFDLDATRAEREELSRVLEWSD